MSRKKLKVNVESRLTPDGGTWTGISINADELRHGKAKWKTIYITTTSPPVHIVDAYIEPSKR